MPATQSNDLSDNLSVRVSRCVNWLEKFGSSLYSSNAPTASASMSFSDYEASSSGSNVDQTIFGYSISALAVKLMKIDSEVNYLEVKCFKSMFETDGLSESRLSALLASSVRDKAPADQYSRQIADLYKENPDMRSNILMRLCKIALADGPVTIEEFDFLYHVAESFSVPVFKIAYWLDELDGPRQGDAFALLKVGGGSSEEQLKDAYHERMRFCHPDRWAKGGRYAEMYRLTNAKASAINAAYRSLMRAKNIELEY